MASVFETLNAINCNEHTEKKNNLTYLSWAWAWAEVKKHYPQAFYTIYENAQGFNYHTDGKTCWVKTGVTIEGLELIEYLPVMDNRNASIPADKVTSYDVNKAIQRSLTKACARHGLGLYIYAGEDLPENAKEQPKQPAPSAAPYMDAARAKEPSGNAKLLAEIQAADTAIKLQAIQARMDKANLSDALREAWQKEIDKQGSKLKATLTPGDGWVANADLFQEEV